MPSTIRLHRVFKTTPERLYKAFIDPQARGKWLPPHGFTAHVDKMDARVGGGYHMSFTNFTTGSSHSFGGEYKELVPGKRIVHTDRFDAGLEGTMTVTIEIRKVMVGCELQVTQEGVPDAIPAEACYLGWGESLELLQLLVEPEIPDSH
jgi:uncharacterized protein YndB with AHSA1/START domain